MIDDVKEKIKYKLKVMQKLSKISLLIGWIIGVPVSMIFMVVGILILTNVLFVAGMTDPPNPMPTGFNGLLPLGIELVVFSVVIAGFVIISRTIFINLISKQLKRIEADYNCKDNLLILSVLSVVFAVHIVGWAFVILSIALGQDRLSLRQLNSEK